MPYTSCDIATRIKQQATALGFDACGFAAAHPVDSEAVERYQRWLQQGHNGCMQWAERNCDVRNDPATLLPGAQTVISLALNYYPAQFQPPDAPRVAYYAYGRDYHEVLRERLTLLSQCVEQLTGCATRPCVDSAPIRERYWAQQAGIGFIGTNCCLIVPGKGSFFFLGEIVTTAALPPDEPCNASCGDCRQCVKQCPAGALCGDGTLDASRCLSCLLIEHHGELPQWVSRVAGGRVVGCDECQLCCPHNAHAVATTVSDFAPTDTVLHLTPEYIRSLTSGQFKRDFAHSAIVRVRRAGLQRNLNLTPDQTPDEA